MATVVFMHIFLLVSFAKLASSQLPCSPYPTPYIGPPLPNIPDILSMDVSEATVAQGPIKQNIYHLYVDAKKKLAVKVEGGDYNNGGKRTIFDGNRKQVLVIKGQNCNVTNFVDVSMDVSSLYGPTNFASGNDFFRFGKDYKPKFLGNVPFQGGANRTTWQECIPSLGENKTINILVRHLFTNNTEAGMQFYGYMMLLPGNKVSISTFYNLVLGIPSPDMLNVPSDIFCEMSRTSYKPPKMPDEFEMNIEFVVPRNKSAFNSREFMDTKEKYTRTDHLHLDKISKEWYPVHEIHDFNTGISYEIKTRTFDCEMGPLKNISWDVAEIDNHHHIRMRTTEEFLQLNHKDYIYEGVTNLRGIPADVFSDKFPSRRNPSLMVRVKWYFSRPEWMVSGVEGPRNDTRVPLMAKYSVNGTTFPVNFFNYDPIEPTYHILWPVRSCYKNNRHYMYFRLNGMFDSYGSTNQRSLTNAIRNTLSSSGKISKLRVSSLLIFKSAYGGVVAVRVYVLGVPSINGTIRVLHPIHQTPLKTAVDGIKRAIKGGRFVIQFPFKSQGKTQTVKMTAVKDSYFDYSADPNINEPDSHNDGKKAGLTGGAVAAITIAMIIVTVVITIAVLQVVLKRRGVQLFSYSRHTNEATA